MYESDTAYCMYFSLRQLHVWNGNQAIMIKAFFHYFTRGYSKQNDEFGSWCFSILSEGKFGNDQFTINLLLRIVCNVCIKQFKADIWQAGIDHEAINSTCISWPVFNHLNLPVLLEPMLILREKKLLKTLFTCRLCICVYMYWLHCTFCNFVSVNKSLM